MATPEPITSTKDIAALTADAELALSNEDWEAAAGLYQELIARQPRNAEHRFKLVQAYDELGRVEDVLELLKDPALAGLEKTKRRLARVYIDLKDYAAAIPLIDELIAAHPDNPKFAKWKAACVEKGGGGADAAERIQRGLKRIESGELEEAERLYVELVAEHPGIARAWLHLGQIYTQQKRWKDAVAPLRTGLELDPDNRKLKNTLARVLLKLDETGPAIALLNSGRGPEDDVDSLLLLQRCHVELHDWAVASDLGERLLALLPAGDPVRDEVEQLRAEAAVRKDLAAAADLARGADPDAAVAAYRKVAERHPRSPLTWLALGSALSDTGRNDEAIAALGEGAAATGGELDVRTALTSAIIKSDDEDRILRHVTQATADGAGDFEAFRWLARYHAGREEWEASLEKAQRALDFDPQRGSARVILVHALVHLGRLGEALDELNVLLGTNEKRLEALQLKGDVLLKLARLEAAIAAYNEAADLSPKDAGLSIKLGAALLLSGDIEGFHLAYNRGVRPVEPGSEDGATPFEEWSGELSIPGKLLVSSGEAAGAGEKILYLRFLKQLLGLGFDVVLQIDEELAGICRRSFPQVAVVPSGASLPEGISHHVPLTGLFRWFKPDLQSLESEQPYLAPDVEAVEAQRARLKAGGTEGRVLVGTSWRSSDPAQRELAAAADRLLAGIDPKATVVELDNRDGGAEELSALVGAMDLVLCGDGPVAHLAGAMGVPTVTVLPAAPEAHWLAKGEGCVWYPSTKLRRQATIDDGWAPVLEQARAAVDAFVRGYDPGQWLSASLEPFTGEAQAMGEREIAEAVRAFVAQGAYRYTAYRSALELIDRLSGDALSRELKIQKAELLLRFGEWDAALTLLFSMKGDDERDGEVERLILSASLGIYDLERALPIARGLSGQDPIYRVTAANILYRMGRAEEALSELRSASLEAPELDRLSSLLGTLLLATGQAERAETYMATQAAVTRSAADYTLLGRALSAQGKAEEALAAYDKAIAATPDDPAANFWRTVERISSGEATRTPLPPIAGETPQVSPDDLVLFFVADSSYFWEHALVLLGSIGWRSPSAKCHVHVVNPDPGIARAIEVVRDSLPDLGLSYSYETVEFGGAGESFVRTYYASVRFVRLAEIFARSPASYLCIDSDCIVRGDIAAQASAMDVRDVGIRMRYHHRPHATVAAGALMLRPTPGASRFVGRVAELIAMVLETGEGTWFLDQIVLSEVLRELGGGQVDATQLDMSYIDWFFHDDSLVWTGKGPRKLADSRYTRELAQYRYIQANGEIAGLMPEGEADAPDA